jgi:HemY protein
MRRLFIVVLIMLLCGVGLIALIESEPGYVLISFGLWTLETSLWVGLLLLLLLYLGLYLLLRIAGRLMSTRGLLSDWLSMRAYSRQLARCQMQLDAGLYQDVVSAVESTGKLHDQELRLLARARAGQENWRELLKLMPRLRKQKVFGERELAAFEERAYLGLLRAAPVDELKSTWAAFPAEQRKRAVLVECYGRRLLEAGDDLEAEKLLTRAIKRDWDGRLVALYGRIEGRDPARRLKQAEKWLKQHPEDARLLLCLGRLSLRNELWGQARDFFESSHRMEPNSEACAELARLLSGLDESELSARYYREGLLLRESSLPDLPLPGGQLPNLQAG